jgi:hypothetical protein
MKYLQSSQHSFFSNNDLFRILQLSAGLYLLYYIYDKFFKKDPTEDNAEKLEEKREEERKKVIQNIEAKKSNFGTATLDSVEIVDVADGIYSSYADNVITDEDTLLQKIRRMGTQADFELVSQAFGLKPLPKWYPIIFGREKVNLSTWLGLLDEDLQGAINHHFNRRGIRLI